MLVAPTDINSGAAGKVSRHAATAMVAANPRAPPWVLANRRPHAGAVRAIDPPVGLPDGCPRRTGRSVSSGRDVKSLF
jgi:hypothetical protein